MGAAIADLILKTLVANLLATTPSDLPIQVFRLVKVYRSLNFLFTYLFRVKDMGQHDS